ncbi:MAG: flagellin modification protein, PseA [Chloroflexi bacterium]|nr:flagellin modification protein, PseA [Chloroflexota bacterium]|tara:strand:+ start:17332 stop:18471 length:1140 start_codon:yes stop_codon:yes gene_type:complete
MKYCKNCLYPDTKPQLEFNDDGICSACTNNKLKETIDWNKKGNELKQILEKNKSKDGSTYDCIIPVSGGKDSTYQTYVIKEEFGLNPLVVNFHPLDQTDIGRKNLDNLKKIGVDCIEFSSNPKIYLKLAKYGLTELGDFQWPEHIGIFTIPVQIAVKYKIPLIIWGENPQLEYGQPTDIENETILDRPWMEKNGGFFLDKIKPQDMTKYGFSISDLKPYLYPTDNEIKQVGVTGIFLGTYIKWDIFKQLELVKKLGFSENEDVKEGTYDKWENLDVYFTVFHDYFKFLKYGFGRTTDHVSIEMRYGRMNREEAIKLIKKYEGKIPTKYLKEFLKAANITINEFEEICDKFTNKELFQTDQEGNLLKDKDRNLSLKEEIK